MTSVVAVMVVVMAVETWYLWRVLVCLDLLGRRFIGPVEDRLSSLTHSLTLLIDTTETCFQVVATQLGQEQTAATSAERAARQRRMVRAVRRGRSVAEMAADEKVAQGEVRLRLHLAKQDGNKERGRHGSMLT